MLLSAAMLVLVTAAALLVAGWELAAVLWRRDGEGSPEGLERVAAAITIAFTLWIGFDWLLLLTGTMTAPVLYARTAVAVIAAAVIVVRRRHGFRSMQVSGVVTAFVILLLLWTAYILWRGAILPPVTHDVLSHHLPRAVLYARAGAFLDLSKLSAVFLDIPVNYEVLLADIVSMMHNDTYTEWLSTVLYLLFIVASGALAQRWWRDGRTVLMTMICVAGMPVLILHSGTHKNDILTGLFMVLALLWGGRYLRTGDYPALLLLACSVVLAAGTKPQGGILGAVLLPLVVIRAVRDLRSGRLSARAAAGAVAVGVMAVLLLGGYTYIDNYLPVRQVVPPGEASRVIPVTQGYGDWANLWQAPYVLLAAPFSPSPFSLPVPWDERWFWKRYEIFFSHLGLLFTLAALAAPFAVKAWRGEEARERLTMFGAALVTFVIMLPVVFLPHGMYPISLPRYVFFFGPAVFAWTVGALLQSRIASRRTVSRMLFGGALVVFLLYAVDMAMHDTFAPFDYVVVASQFPESRYIPFDPYRSTSYVDSVAGPDDVIAVDAAWGGWVHPLFGAALSRDVRFIPEAKTLKIPADADWVVVERAYQTIWGSPDLKTLGNARKQFGKGGRNPAQYRVARALYNDPRYVLVYARPSRNQFVFRRVRR